MLAKLSSKNQLTLSKAVLQHIDRTRYFDVHADGGKIVLTPNTLQGSDTAENGIAVSFAKQAKLSGNNQFTLSKAVLQHIGRVEYFDIHADGGKIVLTPMKVSPVEKVQNTLQDRV